MTSASHDVPTIGVVDFEYIVYATGTNTSDVMIQSISKNGADLTPEEHAFAEDYLRTTPGLFNR